MAVSWIVSPVTAAPATYDTVSSSAKVVLTRRHASSPGPTIGRRDLLLGVASAGLLAACARPARSNDGLAPPTDGGLALVALFAASESAVHTGSVQRLPFAFANARGLLVEDLPPVVRVRVEHGHDVVLGPTDVAVRSEGLSRPYIPVEVRPRVPGVHRVVAEVDGAEAEAAMQVTPPTDTRLIPGRGLPAVVTPTVQDHRGVSPICTKTPTCPLHDITVRAALAEQRPLAVLVASPGTCDVSFCPPALELLLDAREGHDAVRFVHAEVYLDATDTSGFARTTDVVQAFGLDFEPALFLTDRRGIIQQRLDHVYDRSELDEALRRLDP
jgi:hypothetical protein